MHKEDRCGFPSLSTGFEETGVRRGVTCPGGLVCGIQAPKTQPLLLCVHDVKGLNSAVFKLTPSHCWLPAAYLPPGAWERKPYSQVPLSLFPCSFACAALRAEATFAWGHCGDDLGWSFLWLALSSAARQTTKATPGGALGVTWPPPWPAAPGPRRRR